MLVQAFGKRLGKAVGQRFQQDVGIIVMRGLEAGGVVVDAVDADREAADPVACRVDEIGKAEVRPLPRLS